MDKVIYELEQLSTRENIELYQLIPLIEQKENWIFELKEFCEK